jgi:hypothetical protein
MHEQKDLYKWNEAIVVQKKIGLFLIMQALWHVLKL